MLRCPARGEAAGAVVRCVRPPLHEGAHQSLDPPAVWLATADLVSARKDRLAHAARAKGWRVRKEAP